MLNGQGIETGVDLDKLVSVGEFIAQALNIPNQAKSGRAILAKR
jgi:hydroxymethylglutaryl-CoA lyase